MGGGGGGNFMSSRGTANVLTRATAFLAAGFFFTSVTLAILATQARGPGTLLDRPAPGSTAPAVPGAPAAPQVPGSGAPGGGTGVLDQLRQLTPPPGGSQPPQPTR
jgi:preprotein translocase subunit SecG